jgi:hypothetical protein
MTSATLHLTNRRTRWIQLTATEASERQEVSNLDDAFAQMNAIGTWLERVCDRNGLNKEDVQRVELHD